MDGCLLSGGGSVAPGGLCAYKFLPLVYTPSHYPRVNSFTQSVSEMMVGDRIKYVPSSIRGGYA
jgi:hypothetical protein